MSRPPLPPFDTASAITKVRAAEDAWNGTRPGARRARLHRPTAHWRNRSEFFVGPRGRSSEFLARKWDEASATTG
jgi:nuclear transport factor 2 (NTF2) superfamily protein